MFQDQIGLFFFNFCHRLAPHFLAFSPWPDGVGGESKKEGRRNQQIFPFILSCFSLFGFFLSSYLPPFVTEVNQTKQQSMRLFKSHPLLNRLPSTIQSQLFMKYWVIISVLCCCCYKAGLGVRDYPTQRLLVRSISSIHAHPWSAHLPMSEYRHNTFLPSSSLPLDLPYTTYLSWPPVESVTKPFSQKSIKAGFQNSLLTSNIRMEGLSSTRTSSNGWPQQSHEDMRSWSR